MTYSVKALQYMRINVPIPACAMFFQEKLDRSVEVFGYFYLLRGGGHNVLVDTGMGLPPGPEGPREQMFGHFLVPPGADTASLLAHEGLRPEQIGTLILTHLHGDHCSNASLFTNARIYVSGRGWRAIQTPRHPSLYPGSTYPRPVYEHLEKNAWRRVVLVEPEQQILPGISVIWVGGHSPCSQIVVVETARGTVVLTGDLAYYYANLDENIPVAYNVDLAECYEGMDRVRAIGGLVVPSHDPEVLVRHPGGIIS